MTKGVETSSFRLVQWTRVTLHASRPFGAISGKRCRSTNPNRRARWIRRPSSRPTPKSTASSRDRAYLASLSAIWRDRVGGSESEGRHRLTGHSARAPGVRHRELISHGCRPYSERSGRRSCAARHQREPLESSVGMLAVESDVGEVERQDVIPASAAPSDPTSGWGAARTFPRGRS